MRTNKHDYISTSVVNKYPDEKFIEAISDLNPQSVCIFIDGEENLCFTYKEYKGKLLSYKNRKINSGTIFHSFIGDREIINVSISFKPDDTKKNIRKVLYIKPDIELIDYIESLNPCSIYVIIGEQSIYCISRSQYKAAILSHADNIVKDIVIYNIIGNDDHHVTNIDVNFMD